MAKKKCSYVKFIDDLPLVLKIILALPGLDGIFYGIYRICKGHLIAGIIWIILGIPILWIVDLITIILYGKVTLFA
ncbi:MAG TPA: hypothetical protein PLH44_00965 [Bacilli bacterium]|nr:hypothetical protein [Bacilli bacterium]NLT01775.1 hypothetical protein [Acholeplasmataceae bacterium]HNZ78324.1 hypothetical protein [Bacilli bacterium]HOD61757.1 hypothetical protein [Bacilli bacterium]HOE06388.1 hypothetical protein [Bacilli bacterium]